MSNQQRDQVTPVELSISNVAEALLAGEGYGTHVRTAAYFALFLGSLGYVLFSFPWAAACRRQPALLAAPALSLAALLATWRLILRFFVESHGAATGADSPNLFVEAYVLVCDDRAGWWWSHLLLTWVSVACPLVAREVARRAMSPPLALAYLCITHNFLANGTTCV